MGLDKAESEPKNPNSPDNDAFQPGDRVQLIGLQSEDLNGQIGTVTEKVDQRYYVKFAGRTLSVNPINMAKPIQRDDMIMIHFRETFKGEGEQLTFARKGKPFCNVTGYVKSKKLYEAQVISVYTTSVRPVRAAGEYRKVS